MSSMWRLARFPSLAVALVLAAGCGGDNTDTNFDTPGSGGEGGSGSGSGGRTGGGGANTGGRAPGNGGTAPGTGGDTVDGGSGGATSAGGTDGGTSGGAANAGGSTNPDGGTGGDANPDGGTGGSQDAGGAQNAGGSTAGGAQNAGGTSAGGTSSGGAQGSGGAPNRPNGGTCQNAGQCASGNCVGTICCALPCNAPDADACEAQQGTLCINNGTTCQYGNLAADTPCDDGDLCTTGETCFEGTCSDGVPKDCDDANACTIDSCNPSNGACLHPTRNCNDNNPCTTDSCVAATGCRNANNVLACNDGNACTTNDRCGSGQCSGTPRDCSASTSDCAIGVCNAAGACVAQPRNNGQACDDNLNTCSATGVCNGSGTCVDQNDACGPLATNCVACNTGPQCFAGRDCTCSGSGVIEQNGQCVRNTDQCAANPCSANGTCLDPTPGGGTTESNDALCTCRPGFTGNGVTCTCGAGRTIIDTPSGPECVCDLDGTYVLTTTTYLAWETVDSLIERSPTAGLPSYSWALREQTTLPNGTLRVQSIACGGTSPPVCDLATQETHALFTPTQSLGKPGMVCPDPALCVQGVPTFSVPLSGVRPGGSYVEPEMAVLLGIDLTDPAGAWPATPTDTTNGATFVDSDEDGKPGVRQFVVPPGGISVGAAGNSPPVNYGEPVCPRFQVDDPWPYASVPGFSGGWIRSYAISGGTRIRGALVASAGNSISNTCEITGNLVGPGGNGPPLADARMAACQMCQSPQFLPPSTCPPHTSPTDAEPLGTGPDCNAAQVAFYDGADQIQSVVSSTFRLASTTIDMAAILATTNPTTRENLIVQACAEVRAANCPAGETCEAP